MTEEQVPIEEPEAAEPEAPKEEPAAAEDEGTEPKPPPEEPPAIEADASEPEPTPPPADDNDRLMGALAYVVPLVLPAVILASETGKLRPFQRYHAIQSLALSVVSIIWTLLVFIVSLIVAGVCAPLGCVLWILYFGPLVAMVWCAYQAYNGEWVEIPGLTQFLKDQKWL